MNCPKCGSANFNEAYSRCWDCLYQDDSALWKRLGVAFSILKDLVRLVDATSDVDLHLRKIRFQDAQKYVDQEEEFSKQLEAHLGRSKVE